MRRPLRLLAVPLLGLAAAWLARAAGAPTIGIEASPPNPSAGQPVILRAIGAGPVEGAWWDFGDGQSSTAAAPTHAWDAAGEYTVRLTSPEGNFESPIFVAPENTLRLLADHPFEITIEAYDHETGAPRAGRASAQADRWGSFAFPESPGRAAGPEVVVKVVEAAQDGHYGIFWGDLTGLEYTLTIREVSSGRVAVHRKEGLEASGGSDTENFPMAAVHRTEGADSPTDRHVVEGPERGRPRTVPARGETPGPPSPTPTPAANTPTKTPKTPTRTPADTRTPSSTRTPTWTPTITPTPTITWTPTITPTPTPPFIALRAIQWQWNFCPPAYPCPTVCPTSCGNEVTLKVGQTYQVWAYNGDVEDVIDVHGLSSVSAIGLVGGQLPQGSSLAVQTITPMTPGDFAFNCTTFCGSAAGHDGMVGVIHVVP